MEEPFHRYSVRVFRDIVYASPDWSWFDPHKHRLDIYVPISCRGDEWADTKRFPVLMYIHGGAWMFGDKSQSKPRDIGKTLARCGFVTVVISYRLSQMTHNDIGELSIFVTALLALAIVSRRGIERIIWIMIALLSLLLFVFAELQLRPRQISHPCHIHDSTAALSWIHKHIQRYYGDKQRIAIMGHSAGGWMTALLATDHRYCESYGIPMSCIKAAVCISGVYSDRHLRDSQIGDKIGRTIFGPKRKWKEAFPINHVEKDRAYPPLLLLNAEREFGLKVHSYAFGERLRQCNIPYDHHSFATLTHFSIVAFWEEEHRQVLYRILGFMNKHI